MHRRTTSLAGLALAALVAAGATTAPVAAAPIGSELLAGQTLQAGDSLRSPSGRWTFALSTEGDLVLRKAPNRVAPERYEELLVDAAGARLVLQADGNLVLYEADGDATWDTGTVGSGAQRLAMQDDGNVVLYGAGGRVVRDFDTDDRDVLGEGGSLLPGEQLRSGATRLVMQRDGNLVLYSGASVRFASGTSSRDAAAVMQADGNLVVYDTTGRAVFSTRTRGPSASSRESVQVSDREVRVWTGLGDIQSRVLWGSAWTSSTLEPGMALRTGDRRTAPGGSGVLVLQDDGNLVHYAGGRAVFASGTVGTRFFTPVREAVMQTDGNLVLSEVDVRERRWVRYDTGTDGNPGSRLVVQADANLVIYTPDGRPVFASRR